MPQSRPKGHPIFGFLSRLSKSAAIETLCNTRGDTGGLVKRIDENRELLELLQIEAPDLLARCPWVVGWIASNDAFFVHLDEVVRSSSHDVSRSFPRPWPGVSARAAAER